jgi:parvulin-like peptidyl-prolyl isomerase
LNTKPLLAIIVLFILAGGFLVAQNRLTSVGPTSLSKQEIETFLNNLPPQQIVQLTSQPDSKKGLVDDLKQQLILSAEAERQGLGTLPEVTAELDLMEKFTLVEVFRNRKSKEQPQALEVTDQEKEDFYKRNPYAFEQFTKSNPRIKSLPAEQLTAIRPQVAELLITAERARTAGMDKDPLYLISVKIRRAGILARRATLRFQETTKINDEEIAKEYDANKQNYGEARARHILVMFPEQRAQRDKQQNKAEGEEAPKAETNKPESREAAKKLADELLQRIKGGEDFDKLAKEFSDDTGSGAQGGDLGYQSPESYVPPFKQALLKLKAGELSEVVETQFGYHIIRLEDQRTKPLDEALKGSIRESLVEKKIRQQIEDLKKQNLVSVAEDFDLPKPPPMPAPQIGVPPGAAPPAGAPPANSAAPAPAPEKEEK